MRTFLFPFLLVAACGGSPATVSEGAAGPSPAAMTVSATTVDGSATAMEAVCMQDERCDAVDSDCDGRIDEGCAGVSSGAVEVAVAWTGGADLDLVVEGPAESVAVEGRGACGEGGALERRSIAEATPGEYRVGLRYADACESGDASVTASVTVAALGHVLGTYNVAVESGASVDVVRFTLSR